MSEMVKVKLATLTTEDDLMVLKLKTVEGVDIQFELDDVAGALLGITLHPVLDHALSREPRVFGNTEA